MLQLTTFIFFTFTFLQVYRVDMVGCEWDTVKNNNKKTTTKQIFIVKNFEGLSYAATHV